MSNRVNLRLGKRYTAIAVILAVGGLGLLSASVIVDNDWFDNVAIEFGATLLLFGPLLLLGRGVERRLNRVEDAQQHIEGEQRSTAENVAQLTDEVGQARADIQDVRNELSQAVLSRIAETRRSDVDLFAKLRHQPSREDIINALERAGGLGLISVQGPRVELHNTPFYVRFSRSEAKLSDRYQGETLVVGLETEDGSDAGYMEWRRDDKETLVDVLVGLTERVQELGEYPGDAHFRPGQIIEDLASLLEFGHQRATGAGDSAAAPVGRIIQLFPPQWALTDTGIRSTDRHQYEVSMSRWGDVTINWWQQVTSKGWVDTTSFGRAFDVAKALYEAGNHVVKPQNHGQNESHLEQ